MNLRLLLTKMGNSLWCPSFFSNNTNNANSNHQQDPIDTCALYKSLIIVREEERQRMFNKEFQELLDGTYPSNTFYLSDYWTQDELDVLICNALEGNRSITTIRIMYKLSSKRNLYSLSCILPINKTLQELNFSVTGFNRNEYCGIGDDGLTWIAEGLQHNQSVKRLKIRKNQITIVGMKALIEMLQVNETLIELDISENYNTLQYEGTRYLCNGLLKLCKASSLSLQRLYMGHWHIDAFCGQKLSKLVAHPSCQIELLDFNGSSMSNKGAKFLLCHGLAQNKSVTTVVLPCCRVSANCKQVKYIANMLIQHNRTIRDLKVDWGGCRYTNPEHTHANEDMLINIAQKNYFLESFILNSPYSMAKERLEIIDYCMQLNKAGRRYFRIDNIASINDWIHSFEALGDDVNGLYLFIRSKPDLCRAY